MRTNHMGRWMAVWLSAFAVILVIGSLATRAQGNTTHNPRTSWMKTDCTPTVRFNCFRDGTHPLYVTRTRRVDEFGDRHLGHVVCHYHVRTADAPYDWCELRRPS